ncbi:hypothetical protein EVAR_103392_1 [Eumeta japonica]|uniref:Uncharacterized protein n=1 Tax=Eumeta variegata TaxID=151549 RepID=A0A4C1YQU7_EUMVA|nr:hypothetical protein EVAR_103392_1 [Eumeta japonica]
MHGLTTTITINNKSNLLSSKGFIGFSDSAGARCLAAIDSSIRIGTRNRNKFNIYEVAEFITHTHTHTRAHTHNAHTRSRTYANACMRASERACARACVYANNLGVVIKKPDTPQESKPTSCNGARASVAFMHCMSTCVRHGSKPKTG